MIVPFQLDQTELQIRVDAAHAPGEEPCFLVRQADMQSRPELVWALPVMNLLVEKYFNHAFPKLEKVSCCLWEDEYPNAFVQGNHRGGLLLMSSGAVNAIFNAAKKVPNAPSLGVGKGSAFDHDLGSLALAGLLGHELGHIHDMHLHNISPLYQKNQLRESQAQEFAADAWGLRSCTDLFTAPLKEKLIGGEAVEGDLTLGVFRTLVGYGLVDHIDWSRLWLVPDEQTALRETLTHPEGAMRLFVGASVIAEWLELHKGVHADTAVQVSQNGFALAAQTLDWLNTGTIQPVMNYLEQALQLVDSGDSIGLWRSEYDNYRRQLFEAWPLPEQQ